MSSDILRSFPAELSVGKTKIIIIDPHNHIVPYWFREFLRHRCNLIVVRIDAHHDMFHYCPSLPAREGREKFQFLFRLMPYLQDYCREKVNEGNFTCPGFHYGAVGAVYHFNPKVNQIDAYGRVSGSETIDAPRTAEKRATSGKGEGKWIVWDENSTRLLGSSAKTIPVPRKITLNDFHRDMQDCLLPTAIGFDLDGLYGNGDRGSPDEVMKMRLVGVRKVLESVGGPQFICLARSQTPRSYVPERIVNRVQKSALDLINEVYGWGSLSKDVYKFNADNFGAFDSKIAALENESRLPDKFFRALFEGADDGQAPGGGLMEDTAWENRKDGKGKTTYPGNEIKTLYLNLSEKTSKSLKSIGMMEIFKEETRLNVKKEL